MYKLDKQVTADDQLFYPAHCVNEKIWRTVAPVSHSESAAARQRSTGRKAKQSNFA
jgi:hypothetical protein